MKLMRFISSVLSLGLLATSLSAVNVFAADPTFVVMDPINPLTGEVVKEFNAGDIVELPVDIITDSNAITNFTLKVTYDPNVFKAGIDITTEKGKEYDDTYYATVTYNPIDSNIIAGRHNIRMRNGSTFMGNSAASNVNAGCTLSFSYTSQTNLNTSEPDFYIPLTVVDDFDSSKLSLNYGSNESNSNELFTLWEAVLTETAGTGAVRTGTQNDTKVNACAGAFQLSVDNSKLIDAGILVNKIVAVANNGAEVALSSYTTDDNTTYVFPTRLTKAAEAGATATVELYADTVDTSNGNSARVQIGTLNVGLDGTVTSYAENTATYNVSANN